jgi:2-polyprenyl-3-methyl-5-hydroxy-6-metoxy-1,4-benzoquinol methylase
MAKETGEGPMTCRPRGSTSSHGLSVSETSLPGFATDMTDWGKIDVYGQFIRRDPFRNGLHYPAVLAELGDPNEMRILDVGCNEGLFPRLLAAQGASVVGYDAASARIFEAEQQEQAQRLGIQYHVATPRTFASAQTFDAAVSVMVLNYAPSFGDLAAFFVSTQRYLVPDGRFISVVLNPGFSAFAEDFVVRRISKLEGRAVRMEFFDKDRNAPKLAAIQHQYTKEEFERAAVLGGMRPLLWKDLFAIGAAVAEMGEDFWRPCHRAQPYALFIAGNPR